MALRICRNPDKSGDVTAVSPLITEHSGDTGGGVQVKLYVYNDAPPLYYTEATVLSSDASGADEAHWVTVAPDLSGNPGPFAPSLSLGDIMDTDAVGIWVKISVPPGAATQNKTDLRLLVEGIEYAH